MITLNYCNANPDKDLNVVWIADKYKNLVSPWINTHDNITLIENQDYIIIKNKNNRKIAMNNEVAYNIGIKEDDYFKEEG
jgi:hypothetical protein